MSERMTARKRQALEMRSRIQSAALDLFDREGFENVSVEEIAQRIGRFLSETSPRPPDAPWATSITISKARTSWPFR